MRFVLLISCIKETEIDESLALKIKDINFLIPKQYVESAWKILKDNDRYLLLLNQLKVYSLDEISDKLNELGGEYQQLAERTKHKYNLTRTDYNYNLCEKLYEIEYLSTFKIVNEKAYSDSEKLKEISEEHIVGYVKKNNV